MAESTGVKIRGFNLMWDISGYSGPFCFLRSASEVPAPEAYSKGGETYARRGIRIWRDADGVAHALVSEGPWQYEPMDGIGELTSEEAELVIAAYNRLTEERFPANPRLRIATAVVPALAEISAACEAEGTPLRLNHGRPDRTCVECGSAVYGEFCTHCYEG